MTTIVSTGFKLAQAVISNGAITGNQWTNPDNLLLVDNDISQSNPNNAASDVFIGNFNSDLPTEAVVTGIEIKIFGYRGAETSPPITLTPYALDNTSGSDVYYPYVTPFTGLTESYAEYILGGPTYLFATAWTVDMINNFKLGLLANGDISLDAAQLNVYYYVPDPIDPPTPPGDTCDDCNSPIQVQPMYLALPMEATDTIFYLTSFNYPDGTPVQYEDLGACGGYIDVTFDADQPKQQGSNFAENAFFASWTVLPSGIVEVDLVDIENRGRAFHTPYDHDPDLLSPHAANSMVLISNSGHYEDRFVRKCQIGALVSAPITVETEDSPLPGFATDLDFRGGGVVVVNDGMDSGKKIITIAGLGETSGPVTVSTNSATSGNVQVTELEFEINITGINRAALVNISTEELQTVTGVTIDGVSAISLISETDVANNLRTEQWGLVAPNPGTVLVHISLSGPAYISAGIESFVSVNQSTPFGANNTNSGSSTSTSVSLTTTVDNSIVVDSLVTAMTPILLTPHSAQTLNWSKTANIDTRQGASSSQPAGTSPDAVTMKWDMTQDTPWAMTAVEVIGITSSSGGTPIRIAQTPNIGTTYGLLGGVVDGVNTTFTVPESEYESGTLMVFKNGQEQQQGSVPADWTETDPATGTFDFNTPPIVGSVITTTSGGMLVPAPTPTNAIFETITQTGHGLNEGELIKCSGADTYALAQGDTPSNAEVVGIVTSVIDVDNFIYSQSIMGYDGALIPTGTEGDGIFLDQVTPGAMTMTPDTSTTGLVVKAVGVLTNSATRMNFSTSYLGIINP